MAPGRLSQFVAVVVGGLVGGIGLLVVAAWCGGGSPRVATVWTGRDIFGRPVHHAIAETAALGVGFGLGAGFGLFIRGRLRASQGRKGK
jgi:hypothetical protein